MTMRARPIITLTTNCRIQRKSALDATHHPVRPVVVDHQHRRVELSTPRAIEDCGPEWLTTTFGPAAPLTQSDSLETQPPDLPGPAL